VFVGHVHNNIPETNGNDGAEFGSVTQIFGSG
jgi:hypothetical protein